MTKDEYFKAKSILEELDELNKFQKLLNDQLANDTCLIMNLNGSDVKISWDLYDALLQQVSLRSQLLEKQFAEI